MHIKLNHLVHDKNVIAAGAVAFIIGLVAGYGIHGLIPSKGSNFTGGPNGMGGDVSGRMNLGTNKQSNGVLTGTVSSKDSGSITLNTRDGSSHVVIITPATSVSKNASGSLNDVIVGSTVFVSGTTNSNGSVSASLIQLRPEMPAVQGTIPN